MSSRSFQKRPKLRLLEQPKTPERRIGAKEDIKTKVELIKALRNLRALQRNIEKLQKNSENPALNDLRERVSYTVSRSEQVHNVTPELAIIDLIGLFHDAYQTTVHTKVDAQKLFSGFIRLNSARVLHVKPEHVLDFLDNEQPQIFKAISSKSPLALAS